MCRSLRRLRSFVAIALLPIVVSCASRQVILPQVFPLGSQPVEGVGSARIEQDVVAARREATRQAIFNLLESFGNFHHEMSMWLIVDGQKLVEEKFRSVATQVMFLHIQEPAIKREKIEGNWYLVYIGMSKEQLQQNLKATHQFIQQRKEEADKYLSAARQLESREANLKAFYLDKAGVIYQEIGYRNPDLEAARYSTRAQIQTGERLFSEVEKLIEERHLDSAEELLQKAYRTVDDSPRYQSLLNRIRSLREEALRLERMGDLKMQGERYKEAIKPYADSLKVNYEQRVYQKLEYAREEDRRKRREKIGKFFLVVGATAGLAGLGYLAYLEEKKRESQYAY